MHSRAITVCAALLAAPTVSSIIGTNIYHDMPPSEAAFPCITYAESNTPALSVDNAEILTSTVFAIECWHKQSAWALACAVDAVMQSLGYARNFAQDVGAAGVVHQVSLKFTGVKEV